MENPMNRLTYRQRRIAIGIVVIAILLDLAYEIGKVWPQ